jgi:hypothetical protein
MAASGTAKTMMPVLISYLYCCAALAYVSQTPLRSMEKLAAATVVIAVVDIAPSGEAVRWLTCLKPSTTPTRPQAHLCAEDKTRTLDVQHSKESATRTKRQETAPFVFLNHNYLDNRRFIGAASSSSWMTATSR